MPLFLFLEILFSLIRITDFLFLRGKLFQLRCLMQIEKCATRVSFNEATLQYVKYGFCTQRQPKA